MSAGNSQGCPGASAWLRLPVQGIVVVTPLSRAFLLFAALLHTRFNARVIEQDSTGDDSVERVILHAAVIPGARCLDGSPPQYYLRRGLDASKWLIYHEPGGWCHKTSPILDGELENWSCKNRAESWLGSSHHEDQMPVLGNMTQYSLEFDYFSRDPERNSLMHRWTHVWIRYCDGGSYSGDAPMYGDPSTVVDGKQLYFRGKAVLQAVAEDLIERFSLGHATDVVLAGASAGGLGVLMQSDDWALRITKAASDVGRAVPKMVVMLDSAVFPSHQDGSSAACRFRERMESAFSLHRVSSIVLDRCKLGNSKHPDSCMFTTALLKYARLPVFLYSSIYDSYHLKYIMCSEDVDDINAYGRSIYSEIFSALNQQPANGGFIESCTHHSRCWSDIVVKGDTPASAFEKWYRGGTKNALWDMNETYATPVCINARHKHSCKALRFRRRHIEI